MASMFSELLSAREPKVKQAQYIILAYTVLFLLLGWLFAFADIFVTPINDSLVIYENTLALLMFLTLILLRARLFKLSSMVAIISGTASWPLGSLLIYAGLKVWHGRKEKNFKGSRKKVVGLLFGTWLLFALVFFAITKLISIPAGGTDLSSTPNIRKIITLVFR